MKKIPNIYGGGAQTNINGLSFERDTDLMQIIDSNGKHDIEGNKIYKNGLLIAEYFSKHSLYTGFLEPKGIAYRDYISAKLLPDDAFIVGRTCYIIEKKYQNVAGSVDEKLVTFPFKREQYQKMFSPLGIKVEFYYLLNDWFEKNERYRDTLAYIEKNGSKYFFVPNELINNIDI
ncbi:hypothetical protein [uncultured Psychrobacter sp.]|uniref:hypothetical protein n=1 Tax=uncultured Psychrobacter sp. TaxID=259303 RepID=UPI0025942530|nr:hypothetical protein [uncultured Psychrobacter sp.]